MTFEFNPFSGWSWNHKQFNTNKESEPSNGWTVPANGPEAAGHIRSSPRLQCAKKRHGEQLGSAVVADEMPGKPACPRPRRSGYGLGAHIFLSIQFELIGWSSHLIGFCAPGFWRWSIDFPIKCCLSLSTSPSNSHRESSALGVPSELIVAGNQSVILPLGNGSKSQSA
jgi:hypothetical protein